VGPYAEVKSSDFNLRLKMLSELADIQFSEREFQTAGALTEKALADKAAVCRVLTGKTENHEIEIYVCPLHSLKLKSTLSHGLNTV